MSGYKRGDTVTATHSNGSTVIGTVATTANGMPTHLVIGSTSIDVTDEEWNIPVPLPTGKWAMVVPPQAEDTAFPLVLQPASGSGYAWYQGNSARDEQYVSRAIQKYGWTVRSEGIEA